VIITELMLCQYSFFINFRKRMLILSIFLYIFLLCQFCNDFIFEKEQILMIFVFLKRQFSMLFVEILI
jgi:hypothetical protein